MMGCPYCVDEHGPMFYNMPARPGMQQGDAMQIDLNINFSPVQTQLDRIEALLNKILEVQQAQGVLIMTVSAGTQQLLDEVTDLQTTEQSVETLLQGLAAQVEAVAGDRDATLTVVAELKTLGDKMHAAVVANTPSDPTATPPAAPAPAPAPTPDPTAPATPVIGG